MKRFAVIFHPDAETDIRSAYEWGCRVWGERKAKSWARKLNRIIETRLGVAPESCPLAPESRELDTTIRQLIVQRYRVLFIIERKTVTILHVKGAFRKRIDAGGTDED